MKKIGKPAAASSRGAFAVAGLVAAWSLLAAGPAAAAPATFGFTGAEQSYTVPAGISSVAVDVSGAAGEAGGKGARVRGDLTVSPGQILYVEVGATGQCNGAGIGGGAASTPGGGGGGAADVRTVSVADGGGSGAYSQDVNAAGGGGGGSSLVPAGGEFELTTGAPGVTITPQHSLALTATGNGSGYVDSSPAGLDCGRNAAGHSGCAVGFEAGAAVTLTAHPAPGTDFGGFSGGGCTGSGPTCTLTLDSDETVAAAFADPAPAITGLGLSPDAFEVGSADTPPSRRAGSEIGLTLSEDAGVRFRIKRDPKRPATGSPPRNKRSFRLDLAAGRSSVPFTGRIAGRALKPGKYKLLAVAHDPAGQASETARARFRITG